MAFIAQIVKMPQQTGIRPATLITGQLINHLDRVIKKLKLAIQKWPK
jgi:hypothetical protein